MNKRIQKKLIKSIAVKLSMWHGYGVRSFLNRAELMLHRNRHRHVHSGVREELRKNSYHPKWKSEKGKGK